VLRRWAAAAIGPTAEILSVRGLNSGQRPWRVTIRDGSGIVEAVLRDVVPGWIDEADIATGAAALRVAEDHGLPAPRLIASDLNGVRTDGVAVTLETALPGSSALPPHVSPHRLNEAGAAIARVHAVPLPPQPHLPLRTRPTQVKDRARERRWSTLYAATGEAGRPAVLNALRELTGWPESQALAVLSAPCSTPLLQLADDRIRDYDRPRGPSLFLHGDIWGGNMLWDGDTCLALVDWKNAGAGDPGVDLGELRLQMALQYGPEAPQHVLAGWEHQSGRPASDTPYWDIVAALNTPVILHGWPGFDTDGSVLPVTAVTARRDEFLSTALNQLSG
jgi:aminoglycoside phosphotransferase (APT) family kinase protein